MTKRPSMPKSDPHTAAIFQALLPDDPRIAMRPMFGHAAAFVGGNMFAGTFGTHVFVRLDQDSRETTAGDTRRSGVRANEESTHEGLRSTAGSDACTDL